MNRLKPAPSGFTLIELLVGSAISGIVLTLSLALLNQIFQISQRELAQTDTQRELQLTMNFVVADLREAVYVYGGNCLQGQGSLTAGVPSPGYCPGVVNSIPSSTLISSIPIIAFWKLEPLPNSLVSVCTAGTAPATVPCVSGRTYSLIAYFLSKANSANWQGKSRLVRYQLSQYDGSGNPTPNYISPNQSGVDFNNWPYQRQGLQLVNLQLALPISTPENTIVLSDFIDDKERLAAGDNTVSCPGGYEISPGTATLNQYALVPFDPSNQHIRSFYACVKGGTGLNQDTKLFLRGNASGKAGISSDSFLPTLESRVLSQGITDATPPGLVK